MSPWVMAPHSAALARGSGRSCWGGTVSARPWLSPLPAARAASDADGLWDHGQTQLPMGSLFRGWSLLPSSPLPHISPGGSPKVVPRSL